MKENGQMYLKKDDETKVYWDREIETGRIKRAIIDIFFDSYFQLFIQDSSTIFLMKTNLCIPG